MSCFKRILCQKLNHGKCSKKIHCILCSIEEIKRLLGIKGWNIFLFQLFIQKQLQKIHNNSYYRYTKEHSHHAKIGTANCNSKDNPKRLNSRLVTQNFWPKIQTVKLLQNQNHKSKDKGITNINKQINHNTRNCTNYRSEIRYHISNTYNQTEKQRIRQFQNGHCNQTENSDNQRINHFSNQKSIKNVAALFHCLPNFLLFLFRRQGIYNFSFTSF